MRRSVPRDADVYGVPRDTGVSVKNRRRLRRRAGTGVEVPRARGKSEVVRSQLIQSTHLTARFPSI